MERAAQPTRARPIVRCLEIRALLSSYMVTDLGTIGGDHLIAKGINNAGEVVGQADTATERLVPTRFCTRERA